MYSSESDYSKRCSLTFWDSVMFSGVTSRLQSDIDTIKLVLDTHEGLRSLVFAQSPTKQANEQNVDQAETPSELAKTLNEIRRVAPSKLSWQIYDRCAAFTRLYAVFEQFVEDLATDYLRMLPGLFPRYEDLPMNITTQHRIGIGQILLKLGKDGPFRELEERNIIRDLSHGLSGNPNYTLLRDAFLIDP